MSNEFIKGFVCCTFVILLIAVILLHCIEPPIIGGPPIEKLKKQIISVGVGKYIVDEQTGKTEFVLIKDNQIYHLTSLEKE